MSLLRSLAQEPRDEVVSMTLRVPRELHEHIAALSTVHQRSINAIAVECLWRAAVDDHRAQRIRDIVAQQWATMVMVIVAAGVGDLREDLQRVDYWDSRGLTLLKSLADPLWTARGNTDVVVDRVLSGAALPSAAEIVGGEP